MKTFAFLSILVTILVAAPAARPQDKTNRSQGVCPWPGDLDGVKAAPETHKVIFENEHVRVLEVKIPPHSKEPVHTHCLPSTLRETAPGSNLAMPRSAACRVAGAP